MSNVSSSNKNISRPRPGTGITMRKSDKPPTGLKEAKSTRVTLSGVRLTRNSLDGEIKNQKKYTNVRQSFQK